MQHADKRNKTDDFQFFVFAGFTSGRNVREYSDRGRFR